MAIVGTLLEEAALIAIVLLVLPQLGINLPLPGLIALIIALGAYSVITYRKGSRALRKKPVAGLETMIGSNGEVVKTLAPEGLVKIKGELWAAKSAGRKIDTSEEITVVGQEGLKLIVQKMEKELNAIH